MRHKDPAFSTQSIPFLLGILVFSLLHPTSWWAQKSAVNIDLKPKERPAVIPASHSIISLTRMVSTPDQTTNGQVDVDWRISSEEAIGIAGGGFSGPFEDFIAPVRRNEETGLNTGVAINASGDMGMAESTSGEAITLTLTLRDSNGVAVQGGEVEIALGANGHLARFIDELFPEANTDDFPGTLTATAAGGPIAATAIEQGNQLGQFTTLPVNPQQ